MADEVFLADIYPAREMPLPGVDTRLIGREMLDKDVYYGSREEALEWLSRKIAQAKEEGTRPVAEKEGLLLVTMGAGDIDRIVDKVVDFMREGGAL